MSRSYKKTPIAKDNKRGRRIAKRMAAKKVRKSQDVPNGKQYRKVYEPWDIYDYISRWSKKDAINEYESASEDSYIRKKYKSLEEFLEKHWAKYFRRK